MKNLQPLLADLGNLIKEKRISANLSQDELAWRCSLHLNAIWKIEKSKSEIKLSTLIRIFSELKISFNEIEILMKKYSSK